MNAVTKSFIGWKSLTKFYRSCSKPFFILSWVLFAQGARTEFLFFKFYLKIWTDFIVQIYENQECPYTLQSHFFVFLHP